MKNDVTRSESGRAERMPISRRPSFFTPWFDDDMETTRWFDDFFGRDLSRLARNDRFLSPAIDIDETADEYRVCADLPGIKKEDINIECAGNQLTISAERRYENEDGRKQGRRERFYGTYQRSFTLPTGVDPDKIEALYENGELTIRVPKGEQAKAKRIQIGGSPRASTPEARGGRH